MTRSKPDGKTIAIVTPTIAIPYQLTRGAVYDVNKWTYFGQSSVSDNAFMMRKDVALPERTWAGLVQRSAQKPILIGNSAGSASFKVFRAITKDAGSDLKTEEVLFPGGTAEIVASLLRKEVEAIDTTLPALVPYEKDNPELELLFSHGCNKLGSAPNVPTAADFKVPAANLSCTATSAQRMFAGPPGMPEATTAALSEAFRVAINNPGARRKVDQGWLRDRLPRRSDRPEADGRRGDDALQVQGHSRRLASSDSAPGHAWPMGLIGLFTAEGGHMVRPSTPLAGADPCVRTCEQRRSTDKKTAVGTGDRGQVMFDGALEGIGHLLSFKSVFLLISATTIGSIAAILPGISVVNMMALLLPLTFGMDRYEAFMFLAAIHAAGGFAAR